MTPGAREKSKQEVILTTPNIIVGSVSISNGKKQIVIVVKGQDARALKKSCGCEYGEFPELNLIVLLDDSMEI